MLQSKVPPLHQSHNDVMSQKRRALSIGNSIELTCTSTCSIISGFHGSNSIQNTDIWIVWEDDDS